MSTLYIVATPIGNLKDITFRAVEVLKTVDCILCEDTRTTKVLLNAYDIHVPTMSYHSQSALSRSDEIIQILKDGKNLALVSDAGTPCISDPGSALLSLVRKECAPDEVAIVPIPGASAFMTLLSAGGLDTSEFVFLGFLPHKKGRETLFKEIAGSSRTMIFYESPHRIIKTLTSLAGVLSDSPRKVLIGRELTKIFEQIISGTASEMLAYFEKNPDKVRGEFVVAVEAV
ncbi:16S rRNA (cytidine(1402)-2'-O)-methyltransferase [Patescibacteria group bacterium]|nr:MAG: 16S rRNA (cytidine(1402)-2'-O)-methyltransferase [Patescibacteria group bacterium]